MDNQIQNNNKIRLDIEKVAGIPVLAILAMLMLVSGAAFCIFAVSFFNFDIRIAFLCVLGAVFCSAATAFVFVFKKVFTKRQTPPIDIDFNP